jgi:hypothetical protein
MAQDFNLEKRPLGSEKNEPKVIGEVLNEYFASNEPLARAYRERLHPDTHLDVDLKLLTRKPGRMNIGDYLGGVITRDGEDHFSFTESDTEKKRVMVDQRNPHIYEGLRINVNRKDNGEPYPTFNRPKYTENFTFQDFCREAAEELIAVAGLIEDESMEEECR